MSQIAIMEEFLNKARQYRASGEDVQYKIILMNGLIGNLLTLRMDSIKVMRQQMAKQLRDHKYLFQKTTFEVMGKHTWENCHSNILAYLFNHHLIGKTFVLSLIKNISPDDKALHELIQNGSFKVSPEKKTTEGKRIDIFIQGTGFNIVIENKFYARQHDVEESVSQCDHYYQDTEKKYPGLNNIYILLDYKGEEKNNHFTSIDYSCLKSILLCCSDIGDHDFVYQEYLRLLDRLEYSLTDTDIKGVESIDSLTRLYMMQKGGLSNGDQ